MADEVRRDLSESPNTEMKCLFCENPIPLIQSIVLRGVPFCCEGHKQAYHADTQRLMLARLMETRKRYGHIRSNHLDMAYDPENQGALPSGVRPKTHLEPLISG